MTSEPSQPDRPSQEPPYTAREYNEVVAKAELSSVRLMESTFRVNPPAKEPRGLGFDLSADPTPFLGEGFALCVMTWRCWAETDDTCMSCEATYVVNYVGICQVNQAAANAFLETVAKVACYPYFRALVAQLNWAAEVTLPPLPVITADGPRAPSISARPKSAPPARGGTGKRKKKAGAR